MAQLTDLEKVRRQRARRRTVRGLMTLAVFALVVFLCVTLIRQVGDVDLKTAYSDIKEGLATGSGFPVALPGGRISRVDAAGETLVLLSDTNLYTYNETGRQMMNEQHGMVNPAMVTTRDRILVYDRGGNRLNLYTKSALVGGGANANSIYTADLAANGNYVVVTDADDTLAKAVAFNVSNKQIMDEEQRLFRWKSAERPIVGVSLSQNSNELLVGHVDVAGGFYKSDIQKFLMSYDGGDIGRAELVGELLLSVEYRGGGALAITDQRAVLFDGALRETASVLYGGLRLDRFEQSSGGKLALVLGDFDKEKRLTIRVYSPDLEELGNFEVDFGIVSFKMDDNYLYLGGQDEIVILNLDGTPAARAQATNLHGLQPIGQYLYYTTNTLIDRLDVKALTAPAEESAPSLAASGSPPESSAPSGGGVPSSEEGASEDSSAPAQASTGAAASFGRDSESGA